MDYAGGIELVKYQWDVVHDPQRKLFNWSQDEEEGQQSEEVLDWEYATFCTDMYYYSTRIMNSLWTEKKNEFPEDIISMFNNEAVSISYFDISKFAKSPDFNEAKRIINEWKNTTSKTVFENISKEIIVNQLLLNINNTDIISNDPTKALLQEGDVLNDENILVWQPNYACGPSAIVMIFILYEPVKYVKTVIELYEKGETSIEGGKGLHVSNGMKKEKFTNGIIPPHVKAVDYIMVGALRQTENNLFNADFANGTSYFHRGTTPWEIKKMVESLGLNVEYSTYYTGQSNKMFDRFEKAIGEGKLTLILETHDISGQEVSLTEQMFGKHFVVLFDYNKKTNGYVYWSYGEIQEEKAQEARFFYETKEDEERILKTIPPNCEVKDYVDSNGDKYKIVITNPITTKKFRKATKGYWIINNE